MSYSDPLFPTDEHFLAAECEPVVSYPIWPDASGYQVGVVIFLFDLLQSGVYRVFQRLFLFRIMDFELKDIGVAAGIRGFEADVVSAESAFSVGPHGVAEIKVGDQAEDESMKEILGVFPAGIKVAEYSFCCSVDVAVHGFQIIAQQCLDEAVVICMLIVEPCPDEFCEHAADFGVRYLQHIYRFHPASAVC